MTKKCPKRNPNQFLYCDFFIILIFRKLEQNFDEGFSFPPGCNLIKQFQSAAAGNYSTPEKAVHSDWLKISMRYFKQPNIEHFDIINSENTQLLHKGKYHCKADLLFDWFGFYQTCKSLSNSTQDKQLNPY